MENNERMRAALDLMRFKALLDIGGGHVPTMGINDINEVLTVAGLPVIVPEEANKKELEVM